MTIDLRPPEATEIAHTAVHPERFSSLKPSETLVSPEKIRIHDTDIETALQLLVHEVDLDHIAPTQATAEVAAITNHVSYPDIDTPSTLSSARRATVAAQAYLHITGRAYEQPAFSTQAGVMRYDAKKALERAIVMANGPSTGVDGLLPSNPISPHSQERMHPLRIVHAIDQHLLKQDLNEAKDILVTNDWARLIAEPLSVGQSVEFAHELALNLPHIEAVTLFEKAWQLNPESGTHTEILRATLTKIGAALEAYNFNEMADPIAVSSCRLLCAQVMHDLAKANGFDDPKQQRAAHENAIELLRLAAPELKDYIDPKLTLLDTPLKTLQSYSREELATLRETILASSTYSKGSDIAAKMDYYRTKYARELSIDVDQPEQLSAHAIAINGFGNLAVGLTIIVGLLNDRRPVQPASELAQAVA